MSDIEKVLHERGKRYGEYPDHAMITQDIKRAIHSGRSWDSCNPHMQETLDMIAHKIGRIVNGDPYYVDSWTDIVGYARLTEKELLGEPPVQEDVRLRKQQGQVNVVLKDAVATIPGQVIEVDKYGNPFHAYAGTFPESAREPYPPYGTLTKLREEILAFQETVYDPKSTVGAKVKLEQAVQLLWRVAAETKNM